MFTTMERSQVDSRQQNHRINLIYEFPYFTWSDSDRISRNGFKLKQRKFRLDVGKKLFTWGMVRHWHRLTREAVDALEAFKAGLDWVLSSQMQ